MKWLQEGKEDLKYKVYFRRVEQINILKQQLRNHRHEMAQAEKLELMERIQKEQDVIELLEREMFESVC